MGNCNSCGCTDKNEVTTFEVQVDHNKQKNAKKQDKRSSNVYKQNGPNGNKRETTQFSDDLFKKNVRYIVKLQSLWRGYTARKLVEFIKQTKRADSRYFTVDESKETLSKFSKYNPSAKREERPTYTFKTGATYTGQWVGGFRDGFGVQIWPDGARYEGQWKDNRAHGNGKFVHVDGDIYEGNWVNDKANGFGLYIHVNGARYEGHWKDDLQHGQGKETWTDGSVYEGEYLAGKKHGYGIYAWNDGSRYEGEWYENKIKGTGTYTWLDGRKYQGEWLDNNMEGVGVYTWADGRIYEGEYRDDKKHGFGIYSWADRREYQGLWLKGKQHGLGVYFVPGQEMKYGLWEEGKRIEWFEPDIAQQIITGRVDYRQYFRKPESAQTVDKVGTFNRPEYFDSRMEHVKRQFNI